MKHTPLHELNARLGAKFVDYAGWEMPLLFAGIVAEHLHTRSVGSVFDVSHMGRLELRGDEAEALLELVCTRRLGTAKVGQSLYSHVCNEQGGILDDVIVSRYESHWLMVCNASNRERIVGWLQQHATGRRVEIKDVTESTLMIAVQGPAVMDILRRKLPFSIDGLKRYHFTSGSYFGARYSVFRSGYTGEDGVELILPASIAPLLGSVMNGGDNAALRPAGLGARDTLRLEAGMPLYGHELTEQTNSLAAGLAWCVDLSKDFLGAEALRQVATKGPARKLVGLELEGRRIARQGAGILDSAGKTIGAITSGTFSPSLQKSIAMGYVDVQLSALDTALTVDLGGKATLARIVALPFYSRTKSR